MCAYCCPLQHYEAPSFYGFYGLFTRWIPELNITDLGNIPSGFSGHLICTKNISKYPVIRNYVYPYINPNVAIVSCMKRFFPLCSAPFTLIYYNFFLSNNH